MTGISIGIVTALPIEAYAVHSVLDDGRDHPEIAGDPHYYRSGLLPSTDPRRPHRVVVAQQTRDGTRDAAAVCAGLARSFPGLTTFVMCGIAGGVPAPADAGKHVRLGDIVVATEGIVDYDHVRTVDGTDSLRRSPRSPSSALLRADNQLHTAELGGARPWEAVIARRSGIPPFARPSPDTDVLFVDGRRHPHPADPRRSHPGPVVHRGTIGSADRLLRDAALRDELARRHRVRAVEMEGSGVAAAADLHGRSWFMVRGAADYCDDNSKNDIWHPYAALVAAAYVRALLGVCRPLTGDGPAPSAGAAQRSGPWAGAARSSGSVEGLMIILDMLSVLPQLSEEPARRVLIRQLPDFVRTAVPDNPNPRLHVLNVIQTCAGFPGGAEYLLAALRVTLGSSPDLTRITATVHQHWTGP